MFISVTHACAKKVINKMEIRNLLQNFSIQDISTGQVSEEFETTYTSQYKIGGGVPVSKGFNKKFVDLVADHIKDHTKIKKFSITTFKTSKIFFESIIASSSII